MYGPDTRLNASSRIRAWIADFFARAKLRAREPHTPAGRASSTQRKTLALVPFVQNSPVVRATLDGFASATSRVGGGWWGRTILLFVVLPSVLFFLYSAFLQTRGYEAEARVTVRGAQEFRGSAGDASSIISRISGGGGGAKSTIQDAYIVLNYIKSPAIILDLGGAQYLHKYYSSSRIDYFSRLKNDASIEDLLRYWLKRVSASVDTVSGIVTIKVEGFEASDASAIARDIVHRSESLINAITERSRRDAVERAESEVSRSAGRLATTRDKLTVFRDKSAVFDPATRAKSIAELIAKLTLDKISIESSLETLKGSLGADSPSVRFQRSKLATIEQQIAELNRSLTGPKDDNALSAQLATYERLKLDEQFDELMYKIAQSAYQRARQELERQQLYLVVVVPPNAPEEAIYPKVFVTNLLLFVALFIFWSIGALIAASIADQMV